MMRKQHAALATVILLMLAAVVFWLLTGFTLAGAAVPASKANDGVSDSGPASALRARHLALHEQLASNPFQRPLALESSQTSNDVKGDIYAVVPYSFGKMNEALAGPQGWCEILILHLNTKSCKISRGQEGIALLMNVGKKFDQPLADSFLLTFDWRLADQQADYLRVLMTADAGPLGTHGYRITLEAVPLANGKTFLHLSYAYGFGLAGKIAIAAYLSTSGRTKVGFTITGKDENGQPVYVGGMRGLVERNTMRYYIAIESFLGALSLPETAQFEKRINDWFNSIEHYPRQLHEMEKNEYLDMKRREYSRQQAGDKTGLISQG